MLALIDCNNFFVSCERIFRPDLEGKPTIVLSSNDGCAVARSNEAKRLGIPMGAPAFKYRQLLREHNVQQFSANFELYGDISRRIVRLLTEVTPWIEVYSIDESFLDLSQLEINDYTEWGKFIRRRIWREIGVPVSIGIAPTKTLAKLASEHAKTTESLGGVLAWPQLSEAKQVTYLQATPIGDLWGIGRRLGPRLRAEGVATAWQLAQLRPQLAQRLMGIHGRQMAAELRGMICYPLQTRTSVQQSIMRGRTFGEDTNQFEVLEAAVASLTARAARRLRRDELLTGRAGLYLQTNRHKPGYRSWYEQITFTTPTSDTGQITRALASELRRIYNPGYHYHRANVFLLDFMSAQHRQIGLFNQADLLAQEAAQARSQIIDAITSRYGVRQLHYAAEDLADAWQPKHDLRSPRYTTAWAELPLARITM
jgi:DNA polymerase V